MSDNPYQPPQSPVTGGSYDSTGLRVQGKSLVVTTGAVLPEFCIKTNVEVQPDDMQTRRFTWCSPILGLLILLSGLLLILVYFIVRKHCSITFGLSPEIRRKYRNRTLFKVVALIALFFAMPMAAAVDSTPLIIGVVLAFFGVLALLLLGNSPLKVRAFRNGEFWIDGCSPEFLSRIAGADS